MHENVLSALALDESKALAGVKPLHCSLFFTHCFLLFSVDRDAITRSPAGKGRTRNKLSDASTPNPSTELRAAPGRKKRPQVVQPCDRLYATKGDTRATNAELEYHKVCRISSKKFVGSPAKRQEERNAGDKAGKIKIAAEGRRKIATETPVSTGCKDSCGVGRNGNW
jgi:hypothetical protein